MFAEGKVVNIGCGEDPALFGDDTVHVDLDVYNHKQFVKADAHDLPFKDFEFDTAVLGDMLEHTPDPVKVLSEAGRVAKKVVATIYEEWRLKEQGVTIQDFVANFHNSTKKMGFKTHLDYLKSIPGHKDKIVSVTSDDEVPHHPHLHEFKNDDIRRMVKEAGLETIIYYKFQEGEFEGRPVYNWLIVASRGAK
jgi:ubiquinone/menaquinone biosynthesis C-methylase UbiE